MAIQAATSLPGFASLNPGYKRSNPLHRQRYALADADTHGGERALALLLFQAVHRGEDKPRARHAERMAERDGAAVRVDVLGILGNAELPQTGNALRGECLVELDQVKVRNLQAEPLHQLAG